MEIQMAEEMNGNSSNTPDVVEGVAEEVDETKSTDKASTSASASRTINDAIKQVENLGKALGNALQDRANVVMVRVNDDSLSYLDMLVEADITRSRSESAAFLINEGIKANEALFNKIREITDQISALKAQLRETVQVEEE
jgi:hypothetical protein